MPIPESAASENQSERPLLKRLCFSYLLRIFRRKNRNFTVLGKLSHIYLKQIEKISEEEKPETEEKSTKKESEKEVTKENEEEKELGTIGKSPNEKNEKENKEDIVSNENDNDNEVSNEETNS